MELIALLAYHVIADFLLQSREMGKNKSQDIGVLCQHLGIQFAVFFIGCIPLMGADAALIFAFVNACIHGVIDWNIWKLYKFYAYICIKKIVAKKHGWWSQPPEEDPNIKEEIANWKYWEDKGFYDTIGVDQFLHGATLVVLWEWLKAGL